MLTQIDRQFLTALRIRPDDDIGAVTITKPAPVWSPTADHEVRARLLEAQYVESIRNARSERDAEGHPVIAVRYYDQYVDTPARMEAMRLKQDTADRGGPCRCGALHPSAVCYL